MSGDDDFSDLLGPEPTPAEPVEVLVDEAPRKSRPMGEASRALLERSRSYPVNAVARKNTPERLKRLLSYIAEMPVTNSACLRAGVSVSTLKYWLQKSLEGRPGDGFDIELSEDDEVGDDGKRTIRFHEAWDAAMECGVEKLEEITFQRAMGYRETLTYQGKVVYKRDPEKVAIARMMGDDEFGMDVYLLDEFGAPVPETVWKMDPDLAMFILKARKSKTYGTKQVVDFNVKGGVLVVGQAVAAAADLNLLEEEYRRVGAPAVTFDESEEE